MYDIEFEPTGEPTLLTMAGGSSSGFDLVYSEKSNGDWQSTTIANDVRDASADLEIRSDGTPFVTYRLAGSASQPDKHVRVAHRPSSSGWTSEIVARINGANPYASMEIDPTGTLWLMYHEKGFNDISTGSGDPLYLVR